jgi:mono/diheme cytochrome c family protein
MLRLSALLLATAMLSACVTAKEQQRIERGHAIAAANCSSCHAIGAVGDSPAPEAPPFRTLSRNYRVADLEEALAEGISTGHPAMPQFEFSADDAHALVVYLQSIQEQHPNPRGAN